MKPKQTENNPEAAPVGGQHTPTPWQANNWATGWTVSGDHSSICRLDGCNNADANAQFIVRAVNSHAALVRALRRMMNTHGAHGPCSGNDCRDCGAAYQQARAVLASVEGRR